MSRISLNERVLITAIAAIIGIFLPAICVSAVAGNEGQNIVKSSGVKGGLLVHLGSGDGKESISMRVSDSFLVQGLEKNAGKVMEAREAALKAGLNGAVTFKQWNCDHLPYADNVVNLVVASGKWQVASEEIMRVLAPGGVAVIDGKKLVKPWPAEIDSWTHYLHDASGNAVSADTVVSIPGGLQWDAGPKYCRNHETDVSVVAAVSNRGRLFSIVDEGITGISDQRLPDNAWMLVARDAFSGVLLWKKPMKKWGWKAWKPDMDWSALLGHRRVVPVGAPRSLVAVGDSVFVIRVYDGPIECLDAATGKTKKVYNQTKGADEFIWHDGKLIATVRVQDSEKGGKACSIITLDPESGAVLWKLEDRAVAPLTMMASGKNLFYSGAGFNCLDISTGKTRWGGKTSGRSERTGKGRKGRKGGTNKAGRWAVNVTVVAHEDVVLTCNLESISALSAIDGKELWTAPSGRQPWGRDPYGNSHPPNLYVIDGLVWASAVREGPASEKIIKGLDLHTGEVKRTVQLPDWIMSQGHHFRCYRGKATSNFILENKRGTEFMNIHGRQHGKADWARGVCRYGVLPCNGLLYTPPTPCSCYASVQVHGFNALTPLKRQGDKRAPSSPRLVKGPAYSEVSRLRQKATPSQGGQSSEVSDKNSWATFRGNNMRSGVTAGTVKPDVKVNWEAAIEGKLTQPIVVGKTLFVASVDGGTVYAVDTGSGNVKWHYTVDGRVDSPPTWFEGSLLFGSRNGWVYCLNADSGKLAWQYRVAPDDRQIVSYDRLESVWPVHGSVLVIADTVYAAAGRNSYLDGGIYIAALDVKTGVLRHEGRVFNRTQDPAVDQGSAYVIPGSMPDILLSNGKHIFMQSIIFDLSLKRIEDHVTPRINCTGGFLDDNAWNRNFWIYDSKWYGGDKKKVEPTKGQLLVHDENELFGIQYFTFKTAPLSLMFHPAQKGYCLFSRRVTQIPAKDSPPPNLMQSGKGRSKYVPRPSVGTAPLWEKWIPVRVNAMVKAGDVVFAAGVPDVLDEDDPMAAFEGRKGSVLQAFSAKDGGELSRLKLASAPVLDGMIAAHGRLYISTMNGHILCLGK